MLGAVGIILLPIDHEHDAIFAVIRMQHFHTRKRGTTDGRSRLFQLSLDICLCCRVRIDFPCADEGGCRSLGLLDA